MAVHISWRQKSRLPITITLLLFLFIVQVKSTTKWYFRQKHGFTAVWDFRGGASSSGETISAESNLNTTTGSTSSGVSTKHDDQPDSSSNAESTQQPHKSFLLSLFQLNNEIKFQARQQLPETKNNETEDSAAGARRQQRGGALVVTAKPSSAISSRFSSWWVDRVSPSSSRLLQQDDQDDDTFDDAANETSVAAVSSRESTSGYVGLSSWWGGTRRTEQTEQQEDAANVTLVVDEVEDFSVSEVEGSVVALVEPPLTSNDASRKKDDEEAVQKASQNFAQTNATATTRPVVLPINSTALPMQQRAWSFSPYESSGHWRSIDSFLTLGYSDTHSGWKVSRRLRRARKVAAKYTGLHGVLSGKSRQQRYHPSTPRMAAIRRRLAAIDRARRSIPESQKQQRGLFGRGTSSKPAAAGAEGRYSISMKRSAQEEMAEMQRKERVKEIDRLIMESAQRLQDLACEKDFLQRRPNPLFNYTTLPQQQQQRPAAETKVNYTMSNTTTKTKSSALVITSTRKFIFPPPDLVDEYLDMLFLTSRLVKMNHTDLWRNAEDDDDDDELDDFMDVGRRKTTSGSSGGKSSSNSGTWWLRHGLGMKIGEAAERAAYKSVCAGIMSVLARIVSSIHGVNVMKYTDIRLTMEQSPNLPPLRYLSSSPNYAKKAIQDAMRRGAQRNSKKKRHRRRNDFIQRDAVVETLLSHCQISAPLLKLFPLAWTRALLANIITLVAAVIADFCEGVEFQILGHRLTFAFTPITEEDVLRGMAAAQSPSRHRARPEDFEAAVAATALELSQELNFLDRWHERALGSGMLRSQVANLIARLVLSLVDDVLAGAKMDLWATQAGGPRLVAALEYRTAPNYMGRSDLQPPQQQI